MSDLDFGAIRDDDEFLDRLLERASAADVPGGEPDPITCALATLRDGSDTDLPADEIDWTAYVPAPRRRWRSGQIVFAGVVACMAASVGVSSAVTGDPVAPLRYFIDRGIAIGEGVGSPSASAGAGGAQASQEVLAGPSSLYRVPLNDSIALPDKSKDKDKSDLGQPNVAPPTIYPVGPLPDDQPVEDVNPGPEQDSQPEDATPPEAEVVDPVGPDVSLEPTEDPTDDPSDEPTDDPTEEPTDDPTEEPTEEPSVEQSEEPTDDPSATPTEESTDDPTDDPTAELTDEPTEEQTEEPGTPVEVIPGDDPFGTPEMIESPFIP